MLCNLLIYLVQQFTIEIFTYIEFEILVHSRRRIHEKHINNVILNENSFIFVLILIFRSYIFNDNDEIIYRHKVSSSSNDRKFEFLS